MPPSRMPSDQRPITDPDRLLPPRKKESGPLVGIVIILVILIFGAFYFWGARLNKADGAANQAPYIPAGTTTLPDINQQ